MSLTEIKQNTIYTFGGEGAYDEALAFMTSAKEADNREYHLACPPESLVENPTYQVVIEDIIWDVESKL